jgi:hypothetical protein
MSEARDLSQRIETSYLRVASHERCKRADVKILSWC